MLEIILAVCSSFGGEFSAQCAAACEAAQKEPDWMAYYRHLSGLAAMQWAVPNSVLNGPPSGPSNQTWPCYPFPTYPTTGGAAHPAAKTEQDWVAYCKQNTFATAIALPQGSSRVQFAPVFVSPTMPWSVPNLAPPTPSIPSHHP